jgi:DNA-binding CsgD family transcriptional regulator
MAVDAQRRVVMVTEALASLLQKPSAQLVGRRVDELLEPVDNTALAAFLAGRAQLASALVARCKSSLGGAAMTVSFEPLGRDAEDGYMAHVLRVEGDSLANAGDVEYEVSIEGGEPGEIHSASVMGRCASAAELAGRRCYEVVADASAPCSHCPVRKLAQKGDNDQLVLAREQAGSFELFRAERLSDQRVRVRVHRFPSTWWTEVQRARVVALAKKAGLSPREHAVLERLIDGDAPEEIAAALRISARTVRFHQANLLTKLSASSRLELFRVLRDHTVPAPTLSTVPGSPVEPAGATPHAETA